MTRDSTRDQDWTAKRKGENAATEAALAARVRAAFGTDEPTDENDPTNPESDRYWNRKAAQAVREAREAIRAETNAKLAANGYDPMGNELAAIEAAHVEALEEDEVRASIAYRKNIAYWKKEAEAMDMVTLELAHREALEPEAEREAADEREQSDMDE
jgi:hypothetical protein